MSVKAFPIQTSKEGIISNAIEGTEAITTAIVGGLILYFLNKSLMNNFPAYVSIIAGIIISVYLGEHQLLRNLGYVLLVDGIYKLMREYVLISS
jgi:chromate transport protein ChrA